MARVPITSFADPIPITLFIFTGFIIAFIYWNHFKKGASNLQTAGGYGISLLPIFGLLLIIVACMVILKRMRKDMKKD